MARQAAERFPDGVALLDLSLVPDSQLVMPDFAHALGIVDTRAAPLFDRLKTFLRERSMLLVLDSFELVLPAARQLGELLVSCPGLAVLVTSRIPLKLRWEQRLRISPLPVPDLGTVLPPLDELGNIPAVALFVARAQAQRADFVLTEAQAPLVAQLVVQLDGLPLALELVAARLDARPLAAIVHRLDERLRLLRWKAADLPERQRSLQAALDWSYELLNESEQRLFCLLGVFVGRVALDALAAVVAGDGDTDEDTSDEGVVLDGMASLAEQSLVLPERQDDRADTEPEPAFGMLEAVREYAWKRLERMGKLSDARSRHAHFFLALAERAEPQLHGSSQRAWFFRLEREQGNLRAALCWLLDHDGTAEVARAAEPEAALRLAGALGYFWCVRGYHVEGWQWMEEALRRAPDAPPAARARVLLAAGELLVMEGDYERSRPLLEEALALATRRHDSAAVALALTELGASVAYAGEWPEGVRELCDVLVRWQELGDLFRIGETLMFLSVAALAQGNYAEAASLASAALDRLEVLGDVRLAALVHRISP